MSRIGGCGPPALVVAAALLSVAASLASAQDLFVDGAGGVYNPCNLPTPGVQRGDTFTFGITYWPGYTVPNWGVAYNYSTGVPGFNPCLGSVDVNGVNLNYTKWLGDRRAATTSYSVTVDKLAVLRVSKIELDQMWDYLIRAQPDLVQAISMIAFKGQNRSEARYAVSNEAYLTQGTGVALMMGLIINWDKGNFQGFEWFDFQMCAQCGGIYSDRCMRLLEDPVYQQYPQTTCAASFEDCKCRGLGCVVGNCTTSIYVGHRGTDAKGKTMQTAQQLEWLNSYSFTSWFSKLWQKVDSAYDNSGSLVGNVGEGNTVIVQLPNAATSQSTFQKTETTNADANDVTCDPISKAGC